MSGRTSENGERLIGGASAAALVALSLVGLGGLRVWARDAARELSPAKSDTLALALLRAEVERHPENVNLRFRLAREQLSLGLFEEAERSLETAPSGAATGSTEALALSVEVAVGEWRATPPGSVARRKTGEMAFARIKKLFAVATQPDELSWIARMAREIGYSELA